MWKEGWVAKLLLMILSFQPKTAREPGAALQDPRTRGCLPCPFLPNLWSLPVLRKHSSFLPIFLGFLHVSTCMHMCTDI